MRRTSATSCLHRHHQAPPQDRSLRRRRVTPRSAPIRTMRNSVASPGDVQHREHDEEPQDRQQHGHRRTGARRRRAARAEGVSETSSDSARADGVTDTPGIRRTLAGGKLGREGFAGQRPGWGNGVGRGCRARGEEEASRGRDGPQKPQVTTPRSRGGTAVGRGGVTVVDAALLGPTGPRGWPWPPTRCRTLSSTVTVTPVALGELPRSARSFWYV